MKLVVGLGNPGNEYACTRHNIGYMFLDFVTNNCKFNLNKRFKALELERNIDGNKVLFIKPLTFMNLSGETVIKYINFYKLQTTDVLVIQDDLDMEIGKFKLLFNRGDGGHNGIKNIILNLNSREFLRLKIGISKANVNTKDYVLGKFNSNELDIIYSTFDKLSVFVQDYVCMNRDLLICKYNSYEIK